MDEFISETRELIENAENYIDKLYNINNHKSVNILFSLFHSIKGSSSFLSFDNIRRLTHTGESLLEVFRSNNVRATDEDIQTIYETLSMLDTLINRVEKDYNDKGYEKNVDSMLYKLERCKSKIEDRIISKDDFNKYLLQSDRLINKIYDSLNRIRDIGYQRDLIFDIMNNAFTLKMSLQILGFDDLWKLTSELLNFLTSVLSKDIDFDKELGSELKEVFDVIKAGIEDVKKNPKHLPEVPDKIDILKKIKTLMGEDVTPLRPIGEILVDMGAVDSDTIEQALRLQKRGGEKEFNVDDIAESIKTVRKDIRVNTEKFDKLFSLVEEITTIAGEIFIYNINSDKYDPENFEKALNDFTNSMNEFQRLSMSLRMVSLESLFNKIKRLAFQLAKKLDKKINFKIEGSTTTEIDKDIIEGLSYPFVHIIRNSIDHGIEDREERIRKNKREEGNITIGTQHKGNEVWLSIRDDGKGFDRDLIINRAIKSGLINKNNAKKLKDSEVWKLVFEPGFTTTDTVSDVSGRGVGMNVVKDNVEKLRGRVEVWSKKDKGTKILLKIPLTIMEVLTVIVDGVRYSIPTNDILKIESIEQTKIIELEGNKSIVKIKDETIPLIKLNGINKEDIEYNSETNIIMNNSENNIDTLHKSAGNNTNKVNLRNKGAMVVINKNGKKACLYVDEIEDTQQATVKPSPKYVRRLNTVLGISTLRNGNLTFIIDTGVLMERDLQ
ncbi:MAG: chemotaxis protein CheA [Spirochaetota bacterium]